MGSSKAPAYSRQSSAEGAATARVNELLVSPMFEASERLRNLPLFLRQKDLAHVLSIAEIYKLILQIPGYIAEFGVMWGRNLALFQALRECYEPYNHTRKLFGFDTFSGFLETSENDRNVSALPELHAKGAYSVPSGYEKTLEGLLAAQESISHLAHLRRFELVKGDVCVTLPAFLEKNPEAIFALCYLDLDLYKPTRAVLELIKPRLVRGSVLIFDEVLNPDYPGETLALNEIFGLSDISLRRSALSGWKTYFVVE